MGCVNAGPDAPRARKRLLEVCVDSVEGAIAAERAGADRVELCAELSVGGLTPSAGTIALARASVRIPIHVLVRPRRGDFVYSQAELDVIGRDIDAARQLGADGIVFGVLAGTGDVDLPRTRELAERARPLAVTYHRAFDHTRDPARALEALVDLGVERVLSSGQERSALAGAGLLAELVDRAAGRITVMPGGGIGEATLSELVARTRATEYHASARSRLARPGAHANARVAFSDASGSAGDAVLLATDPARVAALVAILRRA
jgi:copper homeostasis protein